MELKKVFASSLRQKILKELSSTREIRVMELVRRTGSTYNELNRNLGILEKEGIIKNDYRVKVKHGKIRVIVLNRDSCRTEVLLEVLKVLDEEKGVIRKKSDFCF